MLFPYNSIPTVLPLEPRPSSNSPKDEIESLLRVVERQQEEIHKLRRDFVLCKQELEALKCKDTVPALLEENRELHGKLQRLGAAFVRFAESSQ